MQELQNCCHVLEEGPLNKRTKAKQRHFCAFYNCAGNVGHIMGLSNPKRKL